ncbi:hypothetical protein DENSPDRAFT_341449 [Dentipellis sp. KUC8613]|nr:hypothetical protein DENSPDRAFT_341449 [Dentipellis sp. KUC8613]
MVLTHRRKPDASPCRRLRNPVNNTSPVKEHSSSYTRIASARESRTRLQAWQKSRSKFLSHPHRAHFPMGGVTTTGSLLASVETLGGEADGPVEVVFTLSAFLLSASGFFGLPSRCVSGNAPQMAPK